tara:strand:- start:193 stop:1701 length:1509 start_codon:yes stop_codon:yes gene_type:complete
MIKIISRKSDLAIIQACLVGNAIKNNNNGISIDYIYKDTKGDIDLTTPLSQLPEIGVFTSDLRESLISEEADIAVHSWKDLPIKLIEGTKIFGTLPRADMRDIIFFKRKNIKKIKKYKNLTLLTSSPRREYNLNLFLKNALPFETKKINFENIRGNIPTRLNKYTNGDSDGIVLAKAAIDRLLANGDNSLSIEIREVINNSVWIIPPLSKNPCAPAQGAIAIEVKDDRKDIINLVKTINDFNTFDTVHIERKILSSYGGGCHQKIGVSYEKKSYGDVLTLKGITDENIPLNKRIIERKVSDKENWYAIDPEKIYPSNIKDYKLFSRVNIKDKSKKIDALRNKNILATRGNVLGSKEKIHNSNILWTSGVKTWFQLAKKGFWVNGSFDGLGESQDNLKFLTNNQWIKLTHSSSLDFSIKDRLFTYKLTKNKIDEDLSKKTHFYWMSGSAFEYAIEKFPTILEKFHSCGPGNTYEIIKKNVTEDRIKIFLNYEDWKNEITNEKS